MMPTERQLNIILESELEFKPYETPPPMQSNKPTIRPKTKKQIEERERDKRLLSNFYYHLECYRLNEERTRPSKDQIIERFFENQEYERKAYQDVMDYENDCYRHNKRLLKAIKKVKGNTFYRYLLQVIKESDRVYCKMEIVSKPRGVWQNEPMGKTIKGIWVDQWSVGTEGDSFEGYVCVQLKENKYLQFRYSM